MVRKCTNLSHMIRSLACVYEKTLKYYLFIILTQIYSKRHVSGDVMSFDVSNKTAFEIPLINVSQCTASKDSGREVALEFHQNEDPDQVSLMEMRFYMPPSQDETVDRVQVN